LATDTDLERYADPLSFAREVNLPLLGVARLHPVSAGAGLAALLAASSAGGFASVVEGLAETRQSLTLRSLLLAGFAHDPECFAVGLALGREWSGRGLRVAVVDLDFWNPTVWRPPPHTSEGFVDVLEYGCSFGRVSWEIVAERLWLVGPGSHPPDEDRIVEHPDWGRAARVFATHVDVTLFVAPLLDRRGFTGKLSKRVDGALLVASVDRIPRVELRDAFLELWGSDAPMIGCVGIQPEIPATSTRPAPAAAGEMSLASARTETPPPPPQASPPQALPPPQAAPPPAPRAAQPPEPRVTPPPERRVTPPPVPRAAPPPAARASAAPAPASSPPRRKSAKWAGDEDERVLKDELEREIRHDGARKASIPGVGKAAIWVGVAALIASAAGILNLARTPGLGPESGAVQQPQPAGEEPVQPVTGEPLETGGAGEAGGPGATANARGAARPGGAGTEAPAATKSGKDASLPFRVHVASFRSEAKVKTIVLSLKMRGLDAWYEPAADLPGWYRVFVGRFGTEAEARGYAAWLLELGHVDRAHSYPSTAR
jgi:hypothetical protein